MMKKFPSLILTILTLTLLFFPIYSFADNEAFITIEPRNPAPYSQVTATLVSYLLDVNTALITWSVNGKEILRGIGERKISLQTGGVGAISTIHARVVTASNQIYNLDMYLTPASVDLLYETPESYVPLFYEGHSLPGEGALVKFVAMPNISEGGEILPSSSLSYSWYVNDSFIDNASGIKKQSASFNLDFLSAFTTIKVVVRSPHGVTAEKSISVYPHEVMPILYTYDDILGTNYTSAITDRYEATKEFTLSLEPFYLSSNGALRDEISYDWLLDGLPVTPIGGTLLSMQPKKDTYGSRNLSISIINNKRRFQKTTTDIDLLFDTRK